MKKSIAGLKIQLANYLQEQIENHQETAITWKCSHCGETHSGNLLKKVKSVKTGFEVSGQQPDLAFLDENGALFAAAHFIKRKTLDQSLIDFYRGKCISLQIKLEPGDDFDQLLQKLHKPDFLSACFNPKCGTCGGYQQKILLWIMDGSCWKCDGPMKVAAVEAGMGRGSNYSGPEDFKPNEIEAARSKGVIIEEHYSKTREEKYLANTCPHCHTFVGSHFLFTEYISVAGYGDYPYEKLEMGYYCERCEEAELYGAERNQQDN
jgi:hypothetical protein